MPTRLAPVLATFSLWAMAFAGAAFWGLRLSAPADGVPFPPAASPSRAAPDAAALGRALGAVNEVAAAAPQAPPAASRFALLGVLAGSSQAGAALIAVDGQPAKPFRVGSEVAPGYVLRSVSPRRVVLGAAGASDAGLAIQMPAPGSAN